MSEVAILRSTVHCVADVGEAHGLLRGMLQSGDRVLCKASRRVALDRLVDRLLADLAGGDATNRCEESGG